MATQLSVSLLLWLLSTSVAMAEAMPCLQSARAAESRNGIPNGLLAAIGRIESGGWGWSVNSNDASPGQRFADAEAAKRYVESLIEGGRRTIDLGCFQVDLFYHPEAFRNWQDAFDSDANADAAATILSQLHARTGDWNQAVALYHSSDPARGQPYLRSVLGAWKGRFDLDSVPLLPMADPYAVVRNWVAGLTVWGPGGQLRSQSWRTAAGLPRVVTP